MKDLQMYLMPALGLGFLLVMVVPWFFVVWRFGRRSVPPAQRRPFQFSLRGVLLWGIPAAALAAWILSWEGDFFSNRRVLTTKAAAIILLVDACLVVLFFRSVRSMAKRVAAGKEPPPDPPA